MIGIRLVTVFVCDKVFSTNCLQKKCRLPIETVIEIVKFSSTKLNILSKLSLVCKEWNNLIKSEEFCKFICHSFFCWRNNDTLNNKDDNNHVTTTLINNIKYQSLLKQELNFWYRWNFYSQPNEFHIFKSNNLNKNENLLRILKLRSGGKQRNLITEPIFYNTGIYYFEIKEKKIFSMLSLNKFLRKDEIASFKKKQLMFYPAISLLYVDGELELNSTAGCKSVKKAKWIKEVVSQQ